MTSHGHTFLVLKGDAKRGRCKYCRARIVWVTTITHRGPRSLPFAKEPIFAPEVVTATGVRYERWPSDLLHLASCPKAPARRSARA